MSTPRLSLDEPLWTAADVAARLNLRASTVYEMTRMGLLPCIRLGRSIRYHRSQVEEWLARQVDGGRDG